MSFIIKKLALVLLLTLSLQAQTGLTQKHLVSIAPEPSVQEVSADTSLEIKYDLIISKHSTHKSTIVLKTNKYQKVQGQVSIKNDNTLIFTPSEELKSGEYSVKVKKINLQDYTRNTRFVRYSKKLCSYFYEDVKECRLYNYATRVKTKALNYSFTVDDNKPKVVSLTLNKSSIQLNEDNTTTISVNAKYDDNTSLDVTDKVEWILSNTNIVSIYKNTITPLSEGTTSLQAKFNNQTTLEISLTVYKEVNGYKLPPEPDETLNNSTLLGIDVNNNGVRDDVERKIIETYREPIKIELMMDMAEVGQMILENPVGDAIVNQKKTSRITDCALYLDDLHMEPSNRFKFYKNNMYNTKQRVRAYLDYNLALSGGVYGSGPADWTADACSFDVDTMLGATK